GHDAEVEDILVPLGEGIHVAARHGDVVELAWGPGEPAAPRGPIWVGRGTLAGGHPVVFDVPVQRHHVSPRTDEAEGTTGGVPVEPFDLDACGCDAAGSLVEGLRRGGAPGHGVQGRFVALDDDEAVAVVVAPAAQVYAAVDAVDDLHSDLLFVELHGGLDIRSGDRDIGQMGEQFDHR